MIKSFRDNKTKALFKTGKGDKKWQGFERVALRKLLMLSAASKLSDLKAPPSNKLEALKDDRKGSTLSESMINTGFVLFGARPASKMLRLPITIDRSELWTWT